MTTRYQKSQIEDVAKLLAAEYEAAQTWNEAAAHAIKRAALNFADLFAADNPPRCVNCGEPATTTGGGSCHYVPQLGEHNFEGGFDRERFLAACGLTTETEVRHGL